jgi:hypothetical protein
MQAIANKLRPKGSFYYLAHAGLNTILPLLVLIFVRAHFAELALILIILSKWRIFAVRPHYWLPNIRANGVDIIVGLSMLIFIHAAATLPWQLLWVLVYIIWLNLLKPGSSSLFVCLQAFFAQTVGLMAIFLLLNGSPLYQLILASWAVCYIVARHFFTVFEEPFTSLYAHTWGYFGATLAWVLGHWLLYYGIFAQPTVLLTAISLGLGGSYYLHESDKLSSLLRKQIISVMITIVIVVVVFSNWSSKLV